ncbi:hypothetical protein BU23DRAFT_662338 [Bimuria novae-zelandiae CBS 107.79]|uniref:Amino acid transporter transmembrane domain-containing protein n=1 Tax=Bimuria novae-zelandiae CBS 107.79 TaxID=1447943 RepID=A0A6A5VIH0_9PLEO|nr:hypothetical protein BU23DRAFT_662338 [Bimuria novae-zelandiae CBS 107.79]
MRLYASGGTAEEPPGEDDGFGDEESAEVNHDRGDHLTGDPLGLLVTYAGYVLGQFKQRVHNLADRWPVGREIGGAVQSIFLVFVINNLFLIIKIAMDSVTGHDTRTIVWGVVGFVVLWTCTLSRTLKKVSYLSIGSFVLICGAVFVTMIAVPTTTIDFSAAFLSVTNIVFAYVGHVALLLFISEFRDPGSRLTNWQVLLAGVIYGHVAAKYVYRTFLSISSWSGITFTFWLAAWIIAESIPNLNNLLSFASAIFASWFTYGLSDVFWLFLNLDIYTRNWQVVAFDRPETLLLWMG